jgi:DNA invertase Pin-like site-specific DNA recombinase
MRRVALFVRVSTADQTTENQERELKMGLSFRRS